MLSGGGGGDQQQRSRPALSSRNRLGFPSGSLAVPHRTLPVAWGPADPRDFRSGDARRRHSRASSGADAPVALRALPRDRLVIHLADARHATVAATGVPLRRPALGRH